MIKVSAMLRGSVFLLSSWSSLSYAAVQDVCHDPDGIDPRVEFSLTGSEINKQGVIVGHFSILNKGFDRGLTLAGGVTGRTVTILGPETSIEFKDLNGTWQRLVALPGSWVSPYKTLEVAKGERATLVTNLISLEVANASASEFRLLLRLEQPTVCIVSLPFIAFPARAPVSGLQGTTLR